MNKYSFTILMSLLIIFTACKDDNSLTQIGSSIQPAGDKIQVGYAQFDITSENYEVDFMYSRPDSFLLGTFYDPIYGTTHADILAQVEYPKDYVFPANTVSDSIILTFYYRTYFGDKYSPMNVSVYEMNKKTFEFSTPYPTNLDPADYVDKSNPDLLLGEKTFSAVSSTGSSDSTYVSIKLSDDFLQKFTNITNDTYTSDELFFDFFKGLYITTDFGSASMLYVGQIDLNYYHHYNYTLKDSEGQDSIVQVNLSTTFPANSWVRQVNRFLHPDKAQVISNLESQTDQIHYLSSPANIYTRIQLPLKEIQETIEKKDLRLVINNAKLNVNIAIPEDTDNFTQTIPANVLLVKESALDRFFIKRELPSDTCAILGTYSYKTNSDTNEYEYFYTFDMAGFISHELKQAKASNTDAQDFVNFVMVPVRLTVNSSSNVTEIAQQFLMNAVTIYGGNHSTKAIKTDIVYSSF